MTDESLVPLVMFSSVLILKVGTPQKWGKVVKGQSPKNNK